MRRDPEGRRRHVPRSPPGTPWRHSTMRDRARNSVMTRKPELEAETPAPRVTRPRSRRPYALLAAGAGAYWLMTGPAPEPSGRGQARSVRKLRWDDLHEPCPVEMAGGPRDLAGATRPHRLGYLADRPAGPLDALAPVQPGDHLGTFGLGVALGVALRRLPPLAAGRVLVGELVPAVHFARSGVTEARQLRAAGLCSGPRGSGTSPRWCWSSRRCGRGTPRSSRPRCLPASDSP